MEIFSANSINPGQYCQISNPAKLLGDEVWQKFKLIKAFMVVLECSQHYTFIFQMLKGSYLSSWWWDLEEIQTH